MPGQRQKATLAPNVLSEGNKTQSTKPAIFCLDRPSPGCRPALDRPSTGSRPAETLAASGPTRTLSSQRLSVRVFEPSEAVPPSDRRPRRGQKSRWRDLNPRPHPYQGCALPLSYSGGRPTMSAKNRAHTSRVRPDAKGVGRDGRRGGSEGRVVRTSGRSIVVSESNLCHQHRWLGIDGSLPPAAVVRATDPLLGTGQCFRADPLVFLTMPDPVPTRKRLHRREISGDVRFLTFSCHRRLPLLSDSVIRDLVINTLEIARERCQFELFAWVVMPEHVHLLLRPDLGTADAADICRAVKQPVAQRAIRQWRESHDQTLDRLVVTDGRTRFWQAGGGFDRNVRTEAEFFRELWYIHTNPVTRGLVTHPTEWAWSSARTYLGIDRRVPLDADARTIAWMKGMLTDHVSH